jgi:molybdopterin synthase catalytic subunit
VTATIRVRVLGFATAGEALGAGEIAVELPAGSRVEELRRRLDADHPGLGPLWPRLAVAVDGELAAAETPLADGCEVALLPPVSGGSGGAAEAGDAAEADLGTGATGLADGPLDPARAIAAVAGPGRGAVVVFLGPVRDQHRGRRVAGLAYSAYRPMAAAVLRRIVADLEAGAERLRAAIVHRLGEVPVGEPSVVIAIAAPHRAAAYEASRTALERLKAEAPIWKRERYADGGAAWREEEPLVAPG